MRKKRLRMPRILEDVLHVDDLDDFRVEGTPGRDTWIVPARTEATQYDFQVSEDDHQIVFETKVCSIPDVNAAGNGTFYRDLLEQNGESYYGKVGILRGDGDEASIIYSREIPKPGIQKETILNELADFDRQVGVKFVDVLRSAKSSQFAVELDTPKGWSPIEGFDGGPRKV